ncbi:MAG: winged helix-turn-helix transcriptional regulator [Acidobacteria bacterium]|nr:winged helix-turn-helix transcriptional regulator [Acidobacteriota bacterium]
MSSAPAHEHHSRRILDALESDHRVSQRSVAKKLGIALGLTNLLVKRLVRKGWVRVIHIKPNRVGYLITPAGIAEKTRMSRAYFESSLQFYKQTRDRIQQQFSALSADWPGDGATGTPKRIVFYGAGEVAEIGYVCLAETDLQLVGVVDGTRTKRFFNLSVCSPEQVDGLVLNGQPFDRLVVMSFGNTDALRAEVLALRVSLDRVVWL